MELCWRHDWTGAGKNDLLNDKKQPFRRSDMLPIE